MASSSVTYALGSVILIARRLVDFDYPARMSAAAASEICDAIRLGSRVYRPDLIGAFLPTGRGRSNFARMAPVTRAETHALSVVLDKGTAKQISEFASTLEGRVLALTADDLGRCKGDPDKSTGQSVLLWAKKNLAAHGLCDGQDVTPLIVPTKFAKQTGAL